MSNTKLLSEKVVSGKEGLEGDKRAGNIPALNDIALAFPFLPMMWVLEHKTLEKHTLVDSIPDIQTNLPLEQQYIQAAVLTHLPRTRVAHLPRTRVAHLCFTIKMFKIRGSNLNIAIYKGLMVGSHYRAQQVLGLAPKHIKMEKKIGEFNKDEKGAKVL
ncbi:hypothetical protein PS15p_205179 [Mucor circinelloides]